MLRYVVFVVLLCAACAPSVSAQKTKSELLGIRLGMTEAEAREHLNRIGRLEREERRDAVWALKDDRRFAYAIVGFDKETRRIRYVTVKAREGGERVRYAEVLDLKRARRVASAPNNYWLTQEVRARSRRPRYLITARGADPTFLTYLSVKIVSAKAEDEEDEENGAAPPGNSGSKTRH